MRSIFFIFEEQNKNIVASFLDEHCDQSWTEGQYKQWNILKNGNPIFYIRDIEPIESMLFGMEEDHKQDIFRQNNLQCSLLYCQIDISGRYEGTPDVQALLSRLFNTVRGYAMDDFTSHLWSYDEIENDVLIEGHVFFDNDGWYEGDKICIDLNKHELNEVNDKWL